MSTDGFAFRITMGVRLLFVGLASPPRGAFLHGVVLAEKHGFAVLAVFRVRRVRREIHERRFAMVTPFSSKGWPSSAPAAARPSSTSRPPRPAPQPPHCARTVATTPISIVRARRLTEHGKRVANLRERALSSCRRSVSGLVLPVEPQGEPLAGKGRVEHDHGHGRRAARLVALDLLDASRERAKREVAGAIRGFVRAGAVFALRLGAQRLCAELAVGIGPTPSGTTSS